MPTFYVQRAVTEPSANGDELLEQQLQTTSNKWFSIEINAEDEQKLQQEINDATEISVTIKRVEDITELGETKHAHKLGRAYNYNAERIVPGCCFKSKVAPGLEELSEHASNYNFLIERINFEGDSTQKAVLEAPTNNIAND